MTRNLLIVPLLLATGVALAEDAPKAKPANPAAETQQKPKEEAQATTKLSLIHI